jgi:hypothetical protein
MMRRDQDPWQLPSLERLGEQFAGLERAPSPRGPRLARQRALALVVAAAVCALVIVLVSGGGRRAAAASAVSRAPRAAERSSTVRTTSTIVLNVSGRPTRRFAGSAAVNFASGAYQSSLRANGQTLTERRRTGGALFVSETRADGQRRWVGLRLTSAQRAALTPAPGADPSSDPLALLRVLARTRSPIVYLGREALGGRGARHYSFASDLASVLAQAGGVASRPASYRRVPAQIDVWLDARGRPLQVRELLVAPSSSSTSMVALTRFAGYGAPVSVAAPAGVAVSPALGGRGISLLASPVRLFERLAFPEG